MTWLQHLPRDSGNDARIPIEAKELDKLRKIRIDSDKIIGFCCMVEEVEDPDRGLRKTVLAPFWVRY